MIETVENFFRGATAMGFLVASGFFFRFWRRSGDRIFIFFAFAFLLLTTNRLVLALTSPEQEENPWPYALRLFAFTAIVAAILDKNLRRF